VIVPQVSISGLRAGSVLVDVVVVRMVENIFAVIVCWCVAAIGRHTAYYTLSMCSLEDDD